jgi:hypothetical protein
MAPPVRAEAEVGRGSPLKLEWSQSHRNTGGPTVLMTTPQISGKYQCLVELKNSAFPITFTIPDIPDIPLSEEQPLDTCHPQASTDMDPNVDTSDSTAQQLNSLSISQPQSVNSHISALGIHSNSPNSNSDIEDSDSDRFGVQVLSVSAFPCCVLLSV